MSGPKIGVDPEAVASGVKRLLSAMDGNGASTDLSQISQTMSQIEGGSGVNALTRFVSQLTVDLKTRGADAAALHNNVTANVSSLQAAVTDLMQTNEAAGQAAQALVGQIESATGVPVTPAPSGGAPAGPQLVPTDGGDASTENTKDEYA
ncbi:hypothetical protein [Microbacterium sp. ZW T5_56]|uniref:hypothetical protein n=1 Tax=Microbacterium sp. ZW T5_56 TaxID=3378081 RepID=UPI003851E0B4